MQLSIRTEEELDLLMHSRDRFPLVKKDLLSIIKLDAESYIPGHGDMMTGLQDEQSDDYMMDNNK